MLDVAIALAGLALAFSAIFCARFFPQARVTLGWLAMIAAFWSLMWGIFAHVELTGVLWGFILGGLLAVPAALAIKLGAGMVTKRP